MQIKVEKRNQLPCLRSIFLIAQFAFLIALFFPLPAAGASDPQQTRRVTGTLTEENGNPLPGATIMIEGTTVGTASGADGKYSIDVVNENSVLVFSFVGYKIQKMTAKDQKVIDVKMIPDFQALEEIVVVGYGTQKKVNLSGAVDVVTSKSIESRPVSNVVQALQGLSPNVNISVGNSGGEMGAKLNFNIRGQGSISGGSVYTLVDGIEQELTNLNPDDIESISVLKDAAASAIYGARAAFGVILVTTKKGRKDGMTVNYNNNFSFASPTIVPHSTNSLAFAEYFNAGSVNDGNVPLFQDIIINNIKRYQEGAIDFWTLPYPWAPLYWMGYSGAWGNTDWYKEHYNEWTPNSTHNLSISGGNNKTQFYISGSAFDQTGLLKIGNDSFNRNTLNSKINTNVFDWLRFNINTRYSRTINKRPSYDRKLYYNSLARSWPTNAPYYPNGKISNDNVQLWLEKGGRYNESQNELTVIPGFEIEPIKGWVTYMNYRWKMNTTAITDHQAKVTGTLVDGSNYYLRPNNSFASYDYESYYNSPNIYSTYSKNFGNHFFSIMAGFEQELIQYQSTAAKRYDLVTDDVPSLTTATGKQEAAGSQGHAATRSYFGRFNYSFKEKYLLEFSMRHDGSSKFPNNYRWGTFPSGSAAYVISKETFWEPMQKYFNLLKLRASYGALGNQDVENYLYVERLPIKTNLEYLMGDNLPNYVGMAGLMSPGLTWEKVNTSNIGLDAGFLNNRLTVSFDYFIRNTLDMLGPAESLPAVLGTEVPRSNNATLRTKGFELVIGWKDNIKDFSYDARFMISDARSTITRYYNPQNLLSGEYYQGEKRVFYEGADLGDIWGFTTTGLFKSDEEAQASDQSYLSGEPWRAGDVQYTDLNNDQKIDIGSNTLDDPGDLSIIGNSTPRYSYSFILSSFWKGFDFNMLWQGIAKRDLALDGSLFWGAGGSQWFSVGMEEHMDYWTEDNPDAYWPRPYLDKAGKNHQVQSRYLQNGAYLRLKSLQFGYNLPVQLTRKFGVEKFRIFVSGENLLTVTKLITIFDPEATGGSSGSGQIYPLQKLMSSGLSITF